MPDEYLLPVAYLKTIKSIIDLLVALKLSFSKPILRCMDLTQAWSHIE